MCAVVEIGMSDCCFACVCIVDPSVLRDLQAHRSLDDAVVGGPHVGGDGS